MSSKTRKFIWSVPVVAAFAVIGALAAFGVLGLPNAQPVEAAAPTVEAGDEIADQRFFGTGGTFVVDLDDVFTAVVSDPVNSDDDIDSYTAVSSDVRAATVAVDAIDNVLTVTAVAFGLTTIMVTASDSTTPTALTTDTTFDVAVYPSSPGTLESSSTTGDAGIELEYLIFAGTLNAETTANNLAAGDRIEIYLEDDYQVPDSIDPSAIYFRVPGGGDIYNGGGRVRAADVSIDTDDHYTQDKDDYAISILIPDMNPSEEAGGIDYPPVANDLVMVITKAAGIKNPTEEGTHSAGFSVLTGDEDDNEGPEFGRIADFRTEAKIALSHSEGGRGTEVTLTATGFNNGTRAEAKVLTVEDGATAESTCDEIMDHAESESLGTANVGDNDEFSIPFTVHQDEFDPGRVNYICARDTEAGGARPASEVKVFNNTESLTIEPASVNSGDEVTVKPRDYSGGNAIDRIYVEDLTWSNDGDNTNDDFDVDVNNDGTEYVFDMPGGVAGVVQIAVHGDRNTDLQRKYITVNPSMLTLSQSEVVANETVIISGSGFFERSVIWVADMTLDGDPIDVDEAGTTLDVPTGNRFITTTSSGEFTATINIWAGADGGSATDADTYEIEVEDDRGYTGSASVTIVEPTVTVTPAVASAREFITISGTNWPASVNDRDFEVCILISEGTNDEDEDSADIDSTGRFSLQYQLDGSIDLGTTHDVVVRFPDSANCAEDDIEITGSFEVPESGVELSPAAAAPGETLSLAITGMPIYQLVERVSIDGEDRLRGQNVNTDSEGNVNITGIVVPFLDPGFYPVEVEVGDEIRVVQLEVLAEPIVAGTAQSVSEALSEISGSLERIFHFNNANKLWTFYDPGPEFEGLNTLTELADGQPYWILVSEAQENVVLNGKTRNLTCVGGDCWNQEVW